jgi:outer membrane protein OmpA-like peptidoglycan-associated protein
MRMFSMIGGVIRMAVTIKKFNHKIVLIVISVYLLIACGCAAVVLGTGAAVGTGTAYLAGMDVRSYESEYHKTRQACLDTLNSLKITVTQTTSDELKTTIHAKRADDSPVYIEVDRGSLPDVSEVGIRSGVIGIWDLKDSNHIHSALKERLDRNQLDSATTGHAAGTQKIEKEITPAVQSNEGLKRKESKRPSLPSGTDNLPKFSIYFATNSNELGASEIEKLDKVSEIVHSQMEATITLKGYTDSIGSAQYNLILAESRVSSVKFYLIAKGVNSQRIATVVEGAKDFVSSDGSEEGRRLNRRVEIFVNNY